jgi:iron complex outermembrane receptor protein
MNTSAASLKSLLSSLVLAMGAASAAQAQDVAADTGLEEVVVTAQKRAESAQTTPISMSVYTSEDLIRKGVTDIQSLSTADTSLNYSNGGSEGFIAIRGILSKDVTEIGDPTVPVGQDWFFTNRPAQLINSLYDIERVEVLRGPQGTLYGRNATGGVVNIVTAKPGKEFAASANIEFGSFNAMNAGGMLNLPLSERMQLRGAFASRKHDGYRDITGAIGNISREGDDDDTRSARVQLAFQPNDSTDMLLSFQRTRIGGVGTVALNIPFVANPMIPGDIIHALPAIPDSESFSLGGPTRLDISDTTVRGELGISLPADLRLTYIGGYSDFEWHQWLPTPGFLSPPGVINSFLQNEYPKTQSHEIRLASADDKKFTWQIGAYYFQERSTNLYAAAVSDPGSSVEVELAAFRFPLTEATSKAVFGQGTFAVSDRIKLSAGVRSTKDEKTRTGVLDIPVFGIFGIPQAGQADFSKTTGHLGLDWTVNERQFAYAKIDTGYKAGGFTTCNPYDAEEVTAFEVGSKNRLGGGRTLINVAAFYNDYKDQQVQTFVPASVCISNSTVQNAGSSKIYGVEAEFKALLGDSNQFDVSLTWLNARYQDFLAQPGLSAAAAGCNRPVPVRDPMGVIIATNCQLEGNSLSLAPDLTVAAGFEHTWSAGTGLEIRGRIEGKYQSEQFYDPFNYGSTRQKAYGLINASLDFVKDDWKITLWARNLGDEDYFASMQEFYTINTYQYAFAPPRTVGVRFEFNKR